MLSFLKGFQYPFFVNRQMRDDAGPRAALAQFQTYPQNNVQGGGTLVGANADKYWRVTSPPQAIEIFKPVVTDAIRGGTSVGTVFMQPLIDTTTAIG